MIPRYFEYLENCPEHKDELLKEKSVLITTQNPSKQIAHFFKYCPADNKYIGYGEKLHSLQDAVAEVLRIDYEIKCSPEEIQISFLEDLVKPKIRTPSVLKQID
jgi:hypothetical protein